MLLKVDLIMGVLSIAHIAMQGVMSIIFSLLAWKIRLRIIDDIYKLLHFSRVLNLFLNLFFNLGYCKQRGIKSSRLIRSENVRIEIHSHRYFWSCSNKKCLTRGENLERKLKAPRLRWHGEMKRCTFYTFLKSRIKTWIPMNTEMRWRIFNVFDIEQKRSMHINI